MTAAFRALALGMGLVVVTLGLAAPAQADLTAGNWDFRIQGRYDFHTWTWAVQPGADPDSVTVRAIPQPIARAYAWDSVAHRADGRYTMTVDVPDGLRCGNVYYGAVIPTRDVYSWDANTLTGTLESSFATGCDGAPGGTFTYPFQLVRW